MRDAAHSLRARGDVPFADLTADLLEELARQYESEPCDAPEVCNNCHTRPDFVVGDHLAMRVLDGGAR